VSIEQSSTVRGHANPDDVRLLEIAERSAKPAIRAISTDIFDTLVWRGVPKPVDAFIAVADRLRGLGMLSDALTLEAFGALRNEAETTARERRLRNHGQIEINLTEIYSLMPRWIFGGNAEPLAAARVEFDVEKDLIVPDVDVVALLDEARALGKLLVAVSDTYFSAAELSALLAQPALASLEFDRVYTSSDYRVNKSGGLFEIALRDLEMAPGQVLHFGDNVEADVLAPRAVGLESVLFDRYPEPFPTVARKEERLLGQGRTVPERTSLGGLAAARAKTLSRPGRRELPSALQPYWEFGANVLGPVLTGFAEWIHSECERAGVPRVLCIMREGAFLADLIARAGRYLGHDLEAIPLWLNRKLCRRAALTTVEGGALSEVLKQRSPPSVGAALKSLGLDPAEVPAFSAHLETTLADPVVSEGLIEHLSQEPALRARILSESRRLREAIVALIQQLAPGDDPFTVVDLGWNATIQGQLSRTLAEAGAPREIVGLYLVTGPDAARQVLGGNEIHGFLGDFGLPSSTLHLVLRSPEVLEQVCMPAEGSQLDLDEHLQPVLAPPATPWLQRSEAKAVRAGVLAFQNEWARQRAVVPGKLVGLTAARRPLRAVLTRSVVEPTADEVAAFGHWQHDAGDEAPEAAAEPLADTALLPRLRYMNPEQIRGVPRSELYWPFGLAAQVDELWPTLLAAAAADQIPWEAMGAPLETGDVTIEVSSGVGAEGIAEHIAPVRNRFGLTSVRASLTAAQITGLTIRPACSPCVLRVDWIDLSCYVQGESQPRQVRLRPDDGVAMLRHENCLSLGSNVLIVRGVASTLRVDVGKLSRRVVSRVDVECAFAALPIGGILPSDGRFANIEEAEWRVARAERVLADMQASFSWRITAPLRAAKRRVR
jgi:FMN phosphatase YigB (HAD superfamily)